MEIKLENNKSVWDGMNNKYSLNKTLRFELKPIGKTLENINKIGLIEEDKQRDKDFLDVKKLMDEYYLKFIERNLSQIKIDINKLLKFKEIFIKIKNSKIKDKKLENEFESIKKEIKNEIYNQIKKKGYFRLFFKKEFIKKVLLDHYKNSPEKYKLLKKFENFNTYFKGFFDTRKNILEKIDIPTSIYYRIVDENLPKFINNLIKYENLKKFELFKVELIELEKEFKNELGSSSLDNFFHIGNFNSFLNQEGIDKFNLIVGGKSLDIKNKKQGINERINLFSQNIKFENDSEKKKFKKFKFEPLFKQIMGDSKSNSFKFDLIETNNELFNSINLFKQNLSFKNYKLKLLNLFENIKEYDLNEIYIRKDSSINSISMELFSDPLKIKSAILEFAKINLNLKTDKKLNDWYEKQKYISIYLIEEGLRLLNIVNDMDEEDRIKFVEKIGENNILNPISTYFKYIFEKNNKDLFNKIETSEKEYEKLKLENFDKNNAEDILIIKNYLDSIMDIFHIVKPLNVNSLEYEVDHSFYEEYNKLYNLIEEIIPLYNKVRNYITKKDFNTKKFKLNFQNSTLLNGWDLNKEKDNFSVILKDGLNYYLGIMSKGNNKIFDNIKFDNSNNYYEKMYLKLLPSVSKAIPKSSTQLKEIVAHFKDSSEDYILNDKNKFIKPLKITKEIYELNNYVFDPNKNEFCFKTKENNNFGFKRFQKKYSEINNDEYKKSLNTWIKFCLNFLESYKSTSNYDFSIFYNMKFENIDEFYKEIDSITYRIWFEKFSKEYINNLVGEGKLFLFQIYNKDFSKYSKGRPNLHTIYWRELFSEENLKDVVYKLNGEAEIFYREKSLNYSKEIWEKGHHYEELKDKFNYPIIKDKRYAVDKFLFHCPITLNFKSKDKYDVNQDINNIIRNNDNIKILSIDRGERHLSYWTLLNNDGDIEKQGTFNIINGKDYHDLLDKIEKERDVARKSWTEIESIKNLKEGYLSQVVHNIAKLAINENTVIVFEDLNFGFKKGRFKIEKQIYQKFEKMLIDKFNYLIFKEKDKLLPGGSLKAYQLAKKFDSFKKLGKQSGILFYVDANYTSKICPRTGFINLLYPKYENLNKSKEFFKKFNYIKYHKEEDLFEFNFNYSNFINFEKNNKLDLDNWSVWSNGIKLVNKRDKNKNNQWTTIEENVTENLKELFENQNLDISKNNLLDNILKNESSEFFRKLIYNLKLILQLRNSEVGTENDYILSCVKDKNGEFFDSRNPKENEPINSDANGAFNIGIKGLLVLDKIRNSDLNKKIDLKVSRNEYLNYHFRKSGLLNK